MDASLYQTMFSAYGPELCRKPERDISADQSRANADIVPSIDTDPRPSELRNSFNNAKDAASAEPDPSGGGATLVGGAVVGAAVVGAAVVGAAVVEGAVVGAAVVGAAVVGAATVVGAAVVLDPGAVVGSTEVVGLRVVLGSVDDGSVGDGSLVVSTVASTAVSMVGSGGGSRTVVPPHHIRTSENSAATQAEIGRR